MTRNNRQIQPIQTRHNGRFYRSRTEARFSVMFDFLKEPYDYEPEGYSLRSGWYLVDFWLSRLAMFGEVKGPEFTEVELQKCVELAEATGFPVLLLPGAPAVKAYERCQWKDGEIIWDLYRFQGDVEAAVEAALSERFGR